MRSIKLAFIFIPIVLIMGCDFEYHDLSVTNNSSKIVSYTMFEENGTFQLNPGKTRIHKTPHNSHLPPSNISVSVMPFNIKMVSINTLTYEFENIDPIGLHIANTLPVSVEISTGVVEYMSVPSITVPANSIDDTNSIYTKNVKFIIENSGGYPAVFKTNFNTEDNKLYVIIN